MPQLTFLAPTDFVSNVLFFLGWFVEGASELNLPTAPTRVDSDRGPGAAGTPKIAAMIVATGDIMPGIVPVIGAMATDAGKY